MRVLREEGDLKTWLLFDYVIADELTHVGNGNKWLRELTSSEEELDAMDRSVREVLAAHGLRVKNKHPINVTDRLLSGFTQEEIDDLQRTWQRERDLARSTMATPG
jgi:uncharacterized ferritin-like protein (DUF455 family)